MVEYVGIPYIDIIKHAFLPGGNLHTSPYYILFT